MQVRRALIIEGGQTIRASLFSYLQDMALDIYSAASLQDARALLPVLKPALTIVDRELHDGDGLDLIEPALQAGARIFVVSTSNEVVDRVRALTRGADDYMSKPANPEEMYLRVRKVLATLPDAQVDRSMVHEFGGVRIDRRRAQCSARTVRPLTN